MKTIKRKFRLAIIFFLIPFTAFAGLQQTVGFGISTLGSVGVYMGYATANPLAIAGGLALGALGGAILVTADGSQPASTASAPITIQLNPNVPLITPTGWSSPSSPPATTATTTGYTTPYTASTKYSTAAAGCIAGGAAFAASNACTGSQTFTSVGSGGACNFNVVADGRCYGTTGSSTWFSTTSVTSCPAGYTLTSGVCNLTTATAVIKPVSNRQEIKRTGNTFSNDPQANPSDVYPASNVSVTSSTVTVNTADGGKLTATINGDGSSTVTQTSPISGTGNSKKSTTDFSVPDGNGDTRVTGQSSTTVTGQGTQAGTTAAASPTLDISSLNKEATQLAIKIDSDKIKSLLGNEDNNSVALDDQKTDYDTKAKAHSDAIKSIGDGGLDAHGVSWSWRPDVPSGTCQDPSGNIAGHAVTIEICPTIYRISEIFGYVLYILTALTLTSIFTGRKE